MHKSRITDSAVTNGIHASFYNGTKHRHNIVCVVESVKYPQMDKYIKLETDLPNILQRGEFVLGNVNETRSEEANLRLVLILFT